MSILQPPRHGTRQEPPPPHGTRREAPPRDQVGGAPPPRDQGQGPCMWGRDGRQDSCFVITLMASRKSSSRQRPPDHWGRKLCP